MPETKGDTSAFALVVHSAAANRDQRGTNPVDSNDTVSGEDKEDRAHLALEIAATSGFVEGTHGIQTSCLRLCNACREIVPVQRLTICDRVPRSIAALVYPGLRQSEKEESSRVFPHRWVLSIHWIFSDAHTSMLGQLEMTKARIKQANSDATDRAVVGNIDMSKVQWPQGTREVALFGNFNRSLDDVPWPGLERLCFGEPNQPSATYRVAGAFDKPLDGVTFPCGLREIFLGDNFDQPIEGIAWPGGLERLSLPGFNHSIRGVQWPPGLKALEFMSPSRIRRWQGGPKKGEIYQYFPKGHGYFNQVLGSTLPPSLERLWLSNAYDQPLHGVAWPNGIVTLGLPFRLRLNCFQGITWPSTVETIFMADNVDTGIRLPEGAKVEIFHPYRKRWNWDDDF